LLTEDNSIRSIPIDQIKSFEYKVHSSLPLLHGSWSRRRRLHCPQSGLKRRYSGSNICAGPISEAGLASPAGNSAQCQEKGPQEGTLSAILLDPQSMVLS
jgi:hypothetical protein